MSKDKNITGLTSLRFNSQNGVSVAGSKIDNADSSSQTRGLALPQVLDDTQRNAIINSDNSNAPILFGTAVYNIKAKSVQITTEDNAGKATWANVGGNGDVSNSGGSTDTAIAIFEGTDGKKIKDSTIKIANVPNITDADLADIKAGHILIFTGDKSSVVKDGGFTVKKNVPALGLNQTNQDRYLMSNFGAIEFIGGDGSVLLDSLSAFTLHTQGVGASARACTVFSGDLPAGSSSPSAVLEINTNEGVLLLSRLSTPDEETLDTVKNGSFWYNKDLNKFRGYQNGEIVTYGGGNISPQGTITKNGIAVWDDTSGSLLRSSTTQINSLGGITISAGGYQNGLGANGSIYSYGGNYTILSYTVIVPPPAGITEAALTFVFPSNAPINGYVLSTDDSGNTVWISKTALNISSLTSSANSYTLQNDEHFLAIDTSTSSQEILLPISSSINDGVKYLIKDAKGFAGINNITIKAQGTDLIENNTQISINTNYGFVELINDQNNCWLII